MFHLFTICSFVFTMFHLFVSVVLRYHQFSPFVPHITMFVYCFNISTNHLSFKISAYLTSLLCTLDVSSIYIYRGFFFVSFFLIKILSFISIFIHLFIYIIYILHWHSIYLLSLLYAINLIYFHL